MSTEQKRPMAGEWWFEPKTRAGELAEDAGYFVKHALPDGTFIVQENEDTIPSQCSIWTISDFEWLVHEPRCTGWNWAVPEREEERTEQNANGRMMAIEAIGRIEAWIREYGRDSSQEFVADLKAVLGESKTACVSEADEMQRQIDELRKKEDEHAKEIMHFVVSETKMQQEVDPLKAALKKRRDEYKKDIDKLNAEWQQQCASLTAALFNVRTTMRIVFGVTTRRFAAICGVSCEQLSNWTGDVPEEKPDFVCKPETVAPAESPDDWVIQDRVPARPGVDERRYRYSDGSCGAWDDSAAMNWSKPARHGDRSLGGSSAVVELRCRRKDYPTVAESGEAIVPMFGMKIVDADRVATEANNEWSIGQKPAEAMHWVGDALRAVDKKQDDVAEVVEIPVWLVTRPSGKRYLVVDDVIETLPDYKVQKCRPMRLEVLK